MPAISVIVPVYKVEPFIHRCVDSILAQTFTDFELILVDDGSPDNCGAICDEYAAQDARVRVIHKPNGGVSSARNAGIDVATGEYLAFVDSDDYVTEGYLAGLMTTSADLVCQTAVIIHEKDGSENRNHLTPCEIAAPNTDQFRELLLKGCFNWTCCKRFRTKIIAENRVRFNHEVDFGEDTLFVVEYVKFAQSICVEDIANYRYVIYDSRQTLSNSFREDRLQMLKKANHLICNAISEGNSKIEQETYLQRMKWPYQDYIQQNIYSSVLHQVKGIKFWFSLLEDDDFCQLVNENDVGFVPRPMRQPLLSRNYVYITLAHFCVFAWRGMYRLRRILL